MKQKEVTLTIPPTPSQFAQIGGHYDCTGHIGPLGADAEWPMYSFVHPSMIVWNAIAGELHKRHWTDKQIQEWLQSKKARWALDGELGDALVKAAKKFAREGI